MNKKIPEKPIVLGKICSCYGVQGWLKMISFTENIKSIFNYHPWFIKKKNQCHEVQLENWRYYKKNMLFKLKSIDDRDSANLLKNYNIIIDSSILSRPKQGEFYWKDLIGCTVITNYGYNFGRVFDIMSTGSNDVLIVKKNLNKTPSCKEVLIPFLNKRVIKKVNLIDQIIEVDWNPNF